VHARRTLVAAATSAIVALTAYATGGTATAQDAATGFSNGTGKATALVAKVAPGVGNLQLALGAGSAVAELRNGLAQSQSQAADLGLIGTTLTAEGCDGGDGALTPDQLPQPLRVDNRKGNAEATADEAPIGGAQGGVGRKEVQATDEPDSAHARTTFGAVNLDPVIKINGGMADATTRIVDGNAREAIATSTVSLDIAGVVTIEGATWRAVHRTGAGAKVEGSFDIGTVAGQTSPLGLDTVTAPTEEGINAALEPTGLSVSFPKVIHITEPADVVRVTPMRILLKDSQLGHDVLGPVLNGTQEQRNEVLSAITAQLCQAAGAILVTDVVATILAGAGFVSIEIGGAEATTADVTFEDPFGGEFTSNVTGGNVPLPASGGNLPSVGGVVPTTPTNNNVTGGVDTGNAQPAVQTGPIERACESVNPVDWPPCSHGAALPLGLLGLGVTAGMAGIDLAYQRRRSMGVPA
jgi:hypothetical protein